MKRIFIPPHPDDNCLRKTKYATELACRMGAQATITGATAGPKETRPDRLWVYACPVCSQWHMTKRENREGVPAVTKRELWEGANPPLKRAFNG